MQIEPTIRDIPVGAIDSIEWLRLRLTKEDPDAQKQALYSLGLSLRPPHIPQAGSKPNIQPTADKFNQSLLDFPVGQLAPVRVLQYPKELNRFGTDYGLIFGYRRLAASIEQKLTAIRAQIIHMTAEEYNSDGGRLLLLMMGFSENVHREDLCNRDYLEAIKRIKELYEKLFPGSTTATRHLVRERDKRGRLGNADVTEPFHKAASRTTGRKKRTIQRDIRLAENLNLALLDGQYSQPISKSVGALLTRLPQEKQAAVLDELQTQGRQFTTKEVDRVVTKHLKQRKPLVTKSAKLALLDKSTNSKGVVGDLLPDLSPLTVAIKLCLDLRHRFTWTHETLKTALPIIRDHWSAAQQLVDYANKLDSNYKGEQSIHHRPTASHKQDNGRDRHATTR